LFKKFPALLNNHKKRKLSKCESNLSAAVQPIHFGAKKKNQNQKQKLESKRKTKKAKFSDPTTEVREDIEERLREVLNGLKVLYVYTNQSA